MLKIVHASDLHLSAGEDRLYGLEVLRELVSAANSKQADLLLLCGDLFDSFGDVADVSLLASVRLEADLLREGCRALYIPGNHEELGRGPKDKLSNFSFGRIELAVDETSSFGGRMIETPDADFICIPHAAGYNGCRDWKLPEKKQGRARVLLMHGVNSAVYSGPDPEERKAGIIPDSLFAMAGADYAALGHVHAARETMIGACAAVYPGSARVWRRGEEGPRKAVYFEINDGKPGPRQDLVLKSAGEYRYFALPVNPDASLPPAFLQDLLGKCSAAHRDYIALRFCGLVENANALAAVKTTVGDLVQARSPRRFEILEDEVRTYGGLAGNELARQFLEKLDARRPADGSPEMARWLAARRAGLAVMAGELE